MVRVLYGDILLLIDFCMNFFVLYTSSVVLHRKIKTLCIVSSALVGGIYSVAKVFISGNDIIDCIISLFVGVLMCFVAFGGYNFLKTVVVFFCTSALVGGIMFAVYFLLGSYHFDIYGNTFEYAYTHIPIWLFTLLAAVSMLVSWIFSYVERDSYDIGVRTICIEYMGRRKEIKLLLDTGNLVKEPISGKNVILIGKWAAKDLLDEKILGQIANKESEELLRKKFRLICILGIDGEKRMYYGFLPDKLYTKGAKGCIERDAYVVICDKNMFFEDCDGLAHPSVVA